MPRIVRKLTAREVEGLRKQGGTHAVGDNLYVQLRGNGASWVFRYLVNGKARWAGLGSLRDWTLAEARERAREFRNALARGKDPLAEREQKEAAERAERLKQTTFAQAAKEYVDNHEVEWKNAKHAEQWRATFDKKTKSINDLPVSIIDTAHVLKVLQPIWQKTPETASRVRMRIEAVLAYATVAEYRSRDKDNPARWRGNLKHMLAAKSDAQKKKRERTGKSEHFKAIPYAELPAFMAKLRANNSISARALEWTILTAARTNETIGATFAEIDLGNKTWTIPATRMKAGREHIVPLSNRSKQLLGPSTEDGYLFPSANVDRPLSNMAMLELVRGIRGHGYTVHGFRSAFRDWCREQTNFPREIAELSLAHANKDKTEAAYARGTAIERRRRLMDAWAEYCMSDAASNAKVVSLRGAR
jgi:integrase